MKVLFVCRMNVGRSQAGMALYNQIHPGDAFSAGTTVENPGEKLANREKAKNIIIVMSEHGIDIANNTRAQINEEMVDQYDKVIVMAEPETIPEWLKTNPKMEMWTIQDAVDQDLETTRRIVDEIEERVNKL